MGYAPPPTNWTNPNGNVTPTGTVFDVYSWAPKTNANGTVGADYYQNGTPINNTDYGKATGYNYGDLESWLNGQNAAPSSGGTTQQANGSITGPSQADLTNLTNAQYATQRSQLQGLLDVLPSQQDNANLHVVNSYQNNLNGLDTQNAEGQRNLGLASDQLNQNKAQNLQQLKDQISSQFNNYLQQPGVGDSSAAGMLAFGLGRQASTQRSNVLRSAGQQQQQIDLQGQNLSDQYGQQKQGLDQWKADQLNSIATQFMTQRQQLEQQMAGADATRAQALAQQNSANMQQALQALQNLQGLYGTQSQQLQAQYQNVNAPSVSLGNLGQYQVQPISQQQLQGFQTMPQANQGGTPDLVAPLFRKPQDQLGF